jgi:uncharacterized protein (TIGR04255 family)
MAERPSHEIVSFAHPPVIEVVAGIQFKALEGFRATHLGLLWREFGEDYGGFREVAPLEPMVETFGAPVRMKLELTDVPPLPRVWFLRNDERGLIQVQRDRLHYNWKKAGDTDQYPRYESVMERFEGCLRTLGAFVDAHEIGRLEPVQYELTYINLIPEGQGWSGFADVGSVLPDLSWRSGPGRFLPAPAGLELHATFDLPDQNGRLRTVVRTGVRRTDDYRQIQVELTVRGIGPSRDLGGLRTWFDLAHEWAVRGFADLIAPAVQAQHWGRTTP